MSYHYITTFCLETPFVTSTKIERQNCAEMPLDSDTEKVKDYTVSHMKALVKDEYLHWTKHEYIELCDMAANRLTLFNARRAGEPARLAITNWLDAKSDVWLSQDRLSNMPEADWSLFTELKIMYQTGKGNDLVPFLVLQDTYKALNKLSDLDGVSE